MHKFSVTGRFRVEEQNMKWRVPTKIEKSNMCV